MFYNNLPKNKIMEIYSFAINKRKEKGIGQRKLSKLIEEEFEVKIHENTIANWIYFNKIPFRSEKTQFKPLAKPEKGNLYRLYAIEKQSAQKIAKRYNVSTIIVLNWLRSYDIPTRTHKESMNTLLIKEELKNQKLRRPTKDFSEMSPEKAYIIGVLCGDACINNKNIRLEIRKDEEFIKEFSDCFERIYGLKYNYYYYKKRDSYVLYISSQIICGDLLRYGDFKTFVWRIPKEIMKSDSETLASNFLRGFYDSEGSASKYCVSTTSANKLGLEDVSLLLTKFEIKNKIGIVRKKYYVINITGKERLKIFKEKIGFTIKRKMENLMK